MAHMAKQKPPNPQGKLSGFPYQAMWEELGPLWESLRLSDDSIVKFETLRSEILARGGTLGAGVTTRKILRVFEPLPVPPRKRWRMSIRLYRAAAAYLIPAMSRELGRAPRDLEQRLRVLQTRSAEMVQALADIDVMAEIWLGLLRSGVNRPKVAKPVFHFNKLKDELTDLEKSTDRFVEDMPKWARGTSENVLRTRWAEASYRIIETSTWHSIEVRQADSAGRNPRPIGPWAKALFDYMTLVDPKMSNSAKVKAVLHAKKPLVERMRGMPLK